MENEIKLVNAIEGSIVSDKMLDKADLIHEYAKEVGRLQGELKVRDADIQNLINETDQELAKAQKEVKVVIAAGNGITHTSMIRDPWSGLLNIVQNTPSNVKEITTVNVDNLGELASAVAIGDAKKLNDEADKTLKEAKRLEEAAKASREADNKLIDQLKKSQKDAIDKAVDYNERSNIKTIAELNLNIKALEKEADLLLDERINLAKERDLTLEVMGHKLRMYKNRVAILERPTKTLLDSINDRLSSWMFVRRIKRLTS